MWSDDSGSARVNVCVWGGGTRVDGQERKRERETVKERAPRDSEAEGLGEQQQQRKGASQASVGLKREAPAKTVRV